MTRRVLPLALAAALLIAGAIAWRVVRARETALPPAIAVAELVRDLSRTLDPGAVVTQALDDPTRTGELRPGDPLMGQGARPGLLTPPPSRLRFQVDVPADAVLTFAVGVQGDGKRDRERSGVRFAVVVDGSELWSRTINPASSRRQRRWFDERLDLARFAGRRVDLELHTDAAPSGRPLSGLAGWSGVRLVHEQHRPRQRADPAHPNVLVLLVDTLRADHLGVYGATPSPSPHLDGLAATGLVFEQAVAQAPWTLPSVATLFTGLHPRSHGAIGEIGAPTTAAWGFLPDAVDTIAERATRAGITTVGVSTNPIVSRGTNLAQGFERFDELPWSDKQRNWASAVAVNRAFADWLARNREWRFLAYLHYMEPHDPYTPPAALRPPPPPGMRQDLEAGWVLDVAQRLLTRGDIALPADQVAYLRALYDGEIRTWDAELPHLLDVLEDTGVRDSTVIVVTADHGEEFMEHGQLRHRKHLYDEAIRVPLVLAGPRVPAAQRPEQAEGIDLHPTVAALLDLPASATSLPGHNLLRPLPARVAIAETRGGLLRDGRKADLVAARTPAWKLIEAPALRATESYDLPRDPGEQTILPRETADGPALSRALEEFVRSAAVPPAREGYDPALREKLRALGYTD